MKRFSLLAVPVALALSGEAFAQSIPAIERASGACTSCAPDGWSVTIISPDIIVGNGPWPGGTYTMTDIDGGPVQGANMALMLSGSTTRETVSTTLTGLVVSQAYDVSVQYQSAKLYSGSITYENGSFVLKVGSTSASYPTSPGDTWQTATVSFVATATTETVSITIADLGTGTYGGAVVADGITVTSATIDNDLDDDGFDSAASGGTDCDDTDASVYPGAPETADGVDDDCDGTVDEGTAWYDDDGDGFAEDGGDCDDADDTVHPAAIETCDGEDDDCDGTIDEGTDCYDDDADGFTEADGDCNDADDKIAPDATEDFANGVDDDCDGTVDSGAYDGDGDGTTVEGGDCDDDDATTHEGAPELADGVDNDCDGVIDEGTSAYDDDGDGFTEDEGDCNDADADTHADADEDPTNGRDDDCDGTVDEDGPTTDDDGDGYSEAQGDCDDADADVSPDGTESKNDVDDDCDGTVDEGFIDADGDGFSEDEGDCDDYDGYAAPGLRETCDAADNDCDGEIDEGVCDEGGEIPPRSSKCGCNAATGGFGVLPLLSALLLVRRRRV